MDTGIRSVCLTGGCFQNQRLQASLSDRLKCHGLTVFTQSKVPSGDGGLSLGQAVIAAHAIHSDNQYAVIPTDPDVAPE
jgi:hydrogenase maturation protein HypF